LEAGLTTSLRTKHYCHESTRGGQVPRRYVQPTKEEEKEEGKRERGDEEEEEINLILAEPARKLGIEVTASETFLCLQLQGAILCLVNSDPKFLNGNYFLFMKAENVYTHVSSDI
jgi:hypothetical protein